MADNGQSNQRGFWHWLRNLFPRETPVSKARETPLSENERRQTRPARSRVTTGRVSKPQSPTGSRSPRARRRKPSGWFTKRPPAKTSQQPPQGSRKTAAPSGNCKAFTAQLKLIVRRRNDIMLYERQRDDNDQHWARLQQQIDAVCLRRGRLRQDASDEVRSERYSLQQVIDQWQRELQGLDERKTRLENMLRIWTESLAIAEERVFESLDWVLEFCAGAADCIKLTPVLHESFRDAAEIRNFVNRQQEEQRSLRERSIRRRELLANSNAEERSAQDDRSDVLDRAMPSRVMWRERTMQSLFSSVRATLLAQGLIAVEAGDAREITGGRVEALDDTPRPRPALSTQAVQAYEQWGKGLEYWLKNHDNFSDTFQEAWVDYWTENPDGTRSQFDDDRRDDYAAAAANVAEATRQYVKARDCVMKCGGEPLKLRTDRWWHDFGEYAGVHPDDGATGSLNTAGREALEQLKEDIKPDIWRWMGSNSGHPTSDPERSDLPERVIAPEGYARLLAYCRRREDEDSARLAEELGSRQPAVDDREYDWLIARRDQAEDERQNVAPWDSYSVQQRIPYLRGRIDGIRGRERDAGPPES